MNYDIGVSSSSPPRSTLSGPRSADGWGGGTYSGVLRGCVFFFGPFVILIISICHNHNPYQYHQHHHHHLLQSREIASLFWGLLWFSAFVWRFNPGASKNQNPKQKKPTLKVWSWEVRWLTFTHFDVQDSLICLFYIHPFSGLKIIAKPESWLSQIGHEPRS